MSFLDHIRLATPKECDCVNNCVAPTEKKAVLEGAVNIMKFHLDHIENSRIFWSRRKTVGALATGCGVAITGGGAAAFALGVVSPWIAIASVIVGIALILTYARQVSLAKKKLKELTANEPGAEWHKAQEYVTKCQEAAKKEGEDCAINMMEVWLTHCIDFFDTMNQSFGEKGSAQSHKNIDKFFRANPFRPAVYDEFYKLLKNEKNKADLSKEKKENITYFSTLIYFDKLNFKQYDSNRQTDLKSGLKETAIYDKLYDDIKRFLADEHKLRKQAKTTFNDYIA